MKTIALAVLALTLAACQPRATDIDRWRDHDEDGPERLAAVLVSPTTTAPVARDAALALLHVVRVGRHVGIDLFAVAVEGATNRDALVDALAPALAERIRSRPEGRDAFVDKDGAVAILGFAKDAAKATLTSALVEWLEKTGWGHVDDLGQRYSLDATAAAVGPPAARVLRQFLWPAEGGRLRFTTVIVATGDDETTAATRKMLEKTIYFVAERGWRASMRDRVIATNAKNGLHPTLAQIDAQLRAWQTAQLQDLYDAALVAHATEATDAMLDAAFPRSRLREVEPEERVPDEARIAAIAAVRALAPKSVEQSVDRFLGDATAADRPDGDPVGIAALAAVAASPAWERVFALLDDKHATLRRDAAVALITGTPGRIPDVLAHLPPRGISPADARAIGDAFASVDRVGFAKRSRARPSIAVKMVSLVATAGDPDTLALATDTTPLPLDLRTPCMIHDVPVETLGDFVKRCATTPLATKAPFDPDAAADALLEMRRMPIRRP